MKHVIDPETPTQASSQYRVDLLAMFNKQTYFFAMTHGEPGGIFDSYGHNTFPNFIDYVDVRASALLNRTDENGKPIPPFNMANLWICQGVSAGGQSSPHFAFLFDQAPLEDRCYTFFQQKLSEYAGNTKASKTQTFYVSDIAKFIHEKLKAGYTIGKAVADAYDAGWQFLIPGPSQTTINMSIGPNGNPNVGLTRLIGYYEAPEGSTEWLLVTFRVATP